VLEPPVLEPSVLEPPVLEPPVLEPPVLEPALPPLPTAPPVAPAPPLPALPPPPSVQAHASKPLPSARHTFSATHPAIAQVTTVPGEQRSTTRVELEVELQPLPMAQSIAIVKGKLSAPKRRMAGKRSPRRGHAQRRRPSQLSSSGKP